jgi:phosphoglycolate phosphatase
LIEQVLPDVTRNDTDRALGMFLDFNKQHIADKSRLYPGILETLTELATRDIKMAVISNKHQDLSTLILQTLGIHDLFENICGGNTFLESKPSPLPLLKVAERMTVAPHQCVMVGDSINDIEAGRRANITTIACTWGYGSTEELTGADVLAHSPQELLAVITAGLR